MATVKKDMLISDIIALDRGLVPILMSKGMNCVGCPSAKRETLEQAAVTHGADPDELIEEMNVYLQNAGNAGDVVEI